MGRRLYVVKFMGELFSGTVEVGKRWMLRERSRAFCTPFPLEDCRAFLPAFLPSIPRLFGWGYGGEECESDLAFFSDSFGLVGKI